MTHDDDADGPAGSFLQQLAEFRALYLRWETAPGSVWDRIGSAKRQVASFDFIHRHCDDILGYLLITKIDFQEDLMVIIRVLRHNDYDRWRP